jgi:geranylgeranyl diphosphate synthase type II
VSERLDLAAFLAESRARVDSALDAVLPSATATPAPLHEAMRYAVLSGGKRLRPALAFAGARACGEPEESALPIAVAVELVHTYSLVHDDLPAMDDDDERRGRATVHVKFGEAVAILTGDALLALAFERLAAPDVAPALCPAVVGALAWAAGSRALVGGQIDDLRLDAAIATLPAMVEIHRRKTAALFGAAVGGAGVLAGACTSALTHLRDFATGYGLAFQAADDLDDAGRKEASLLMVLTEPELRAYALDHIGAAHRAAAALHGDTGALRGLADAVGERLR